MDSMIYNPLEEYRDHFRAQHLANAEAFFQELVTRSGVSVEENRETVRQYHLYKDNVAKFRKKLNWLRFWRVLMIITLVLIPLVILKITPKIKQLRATVQEAAEKAEQLLAQANEQMRPLNALFTDRDALHLVEKTLPLIAFAPCFTAEQETDMQINYDFYDRDEDEQSTLEVLAGHYNDNPFLFENKLVHSMGTETYTGTKTIHWTETYRDSNGKLRTRHRSQTLRASVTKPKPYYKTQVILNYCAQGAPDLSFSRDATHLEQKSEREIKRLVKSGEKRLQRKTERALAENDDFMSMSNGDFEVLFDALDRTDEIQFRTMFTPLAQTNMVDLLLSKVGYGDDFNFWKHKRTNKILTQHSQGRAINLLPGIYASFDFDEIQKNFVGKNADFFKAVYFDFAPLWAVPMYQERPVHSLKPIPDHAREYSLKECEALANAVKPSYVVHPQTKTRAILKSSFVHTKNGVDETCITAYSYDIEKRVDIVPVMGGDGRLHSVSVPWDEYIPLEAENNFYVTTLEAAKGQRIIARRNGLCIFQ